MRTSALGPANVGAPELSDIGSSGQTVDFFHRYVANPAAFGNNVVPSFQNLGDENLNAVATFLFESKGGK